MSSLSSLTWLPAILQKNELLITGALWSVISLLTTVLIGIALFGEKPNTVGVIGICMPFISVFLLSLAQV